MAESFIALRIRITLQPWSPGGTDTDVHATHPEKVPILCWGIGKDFTAHTLTTVPVNSWGHCRQ